MIKLYVEEKQSVKKICNILGISKSQLYRLLRKYNIPRSRVPKRPKINNELKALLEDLRKSVNIGKRGKIELDKKLFARILEYNLPITMIAEYIRVSRKTLMRRLIDYEFIKFTEENSNNASKLKKPRAVFKGSDEDKAYIIGLAHDFNLRGESPNTLSLKLTTTHPELIKLVLSLFKPYNPRMYRRRDGDIAVHFEVDPSYSFALTIPKERYVENLKWALENYPHQVLSGLIDADGCITMYKDKRDGRVYWGIWLYLKDRTQVELIRETLKRLGYNPGNGKGIRLSHHQTTRLLKHLKLRHREKIAYQKVILSSLSKEKKYKWHKKFRDLIKRKVANGKNSPPTPPPFYPKINYNI